MPRVNEPVAAFSAEEDIPAGVETLFAQVKINIPGGCWLIASLYGEVKLDPTTTIPNRVVPGLGWKAQTRLADASASAITNKTQFQGFALCTTDAGVVLWTRNDGQPLVRVLVPQAGEFTFGAVRVAGVVPTEAKRALSAVRGLFVPDKLPVSELRALLAGGTAW